MRKKTSAKVGFTLLEIMIVILVIALLLAIAVPHFMRARASARSKACTENLRQFETAKEQWAINTQAPVTARPTAEDLVTEYVKGTEDTLPLCPSGGSYSLNDLLTPPTCDIGSNGTAGDFDDHVLR